MDALHQQVNDMSAKLDLLHQLVEQLESKINDVWIEGKVGSELEGSRHPNSTVMGSYRARAEELIGGTGISHKDVLSDRDFLDLDSHKTDRELTPEIQVQRLTAQLTAAYNRIAALEEQLLLRSRTH